MTSSRIPLRSPTPDDELPTPARWSYQAANVRLDTLDDYRLEINKLYRLARSNQLPMHALGKLVFALRAAADLAREGEELAQLRHLSQQLQALRDGTSTNTSPLLGHTIEGTFAPSQEEPT